MDYLQEVHEDVLIQVVGLTRATLREAEEFKFNMVKSIEKGYRKIVVDLSQCEFIDSTFLGALVVSLKRVTALGGDLRLVGFQPGVHLMIQQTNMYRVFDTFTTREEAVSSFDS